MARIREGREKSTRTGQPKLTFEVNEQVRLQNPESKKWDVMGVVKAVKTSWG